MSPQLVVAWTVVTIYLVVATVLSVIYGLIFRQVAKMKDDEEAQKIVAHATAIARANGTTLWGMSVIAGLRWPITFVNSFRKDN